MARLGRPRKAMATRHPCGKVKISAEELERRKRPRSLEDVDPTPEIIARRQALFGNWKAVREEVCPVDRLAGKLTEEQYYAGRYARTVYARYCIAIRAPRVTAGQLRDFVQGSGESGMTYDQARAAVAEYLDAVTAIRRYSYRSLLEVQRVMHGSPPRSLDVLAIGLTALADHLGFTRSEAA
jgi:hypothetical protein